MRRLLQVVCVWGLLSALAGRACADGADEYDVKLAYLYNFCNYVRWPAAAGEDVVVGVLGEAFSDAQLQKLNGRPLGERRVVVRRVAAADLAQPLHVLFVAGKDDAAKTLAAEAARRIKRRPVLLVVEHPDTTVSATVRFVRVGENVRFAVDRKDAAERNLELNAKLLRLSVAASGEEATAASSR